MIDDYSRDLLRSGIIELKAGNRDAARRYLDRALYMSGDHDVMAEAWYQMSYLTDDPVERRRAIENCLAHDLRHARARRILAILDGRLKEQEIIDPDARERTANLDDTGAMRLSPVGARTSRLPSEAEAQRFMCPKCGGRMVFSPDGQSLVCEYCTRKDPLRPAGTSPKSGEGIRAQLGQAPRFGGGREGAETQDFLIAMATEKGHGKPLAEQTFHCRGCGAEFILPPGRLSITCPYCASPHVVSFEKARDLLAPDGIIPHAFDIKKAAGYLQKRLESKGHVSRVTGQEPEKSLEVSKRAARSGSRPEDLRAVDGLVLSAPRGLYLPVWTFDLGGTIDYTAEELRDDDTDLRRGAKVVRVEDTFPVMLRRLPIPASRKLSGPFVRLIGTFDLGGVQAYDPRYLSDWPAELYDIPLADASLDARSQGYAQLKRDMQLRIVPLRLVSASSARMDVESFRLDLLPVWMAEVKAPNGTHLALVNGQTGAVQGELEMRRAGRAGLMEWLGELI